MASDCEIDDIYDGLSESELREYKILFGNTRKYIIEIYKAQSVREVLYEKLNYRGYLPLIYKEARSADKYTIDKTVKYAKRLSHKKNIETAYSIVYVLDSLSGKVLWNEMIENIR